MSNILRNHRNSTYTNLKWATLRIDIAKYHKKLTLFFTKLNGKAGKIMSWMVY